MGVVKIIEIYNESCLDTLARLKDSSIDCILTDPPYLINYRSNRRKNKFNKIKNDDFDDGLFDNFCKESFRVLKNNKSIYIFCSWHNIDFFKGIVSRYFTIKNIIIWVKNNHGTGDLLAQYAPRYEMIIYANKGRCPLIGGRSDDVVFFDKVPGKCMKHPTEKPVNLLEFLIKKSTKEGDIVYDGFMGVGPTMVACMNNDRGFIGSEIDNNFFNYCKILLGGK